MNLITVEGIDLNPDLIESVEDNTPCDFSDPLWTIITMQSGRRHHIKGHNKESVVEMIRRAVIAAGEQT